MGKYGYTETKTGWRFGPIRGNAKAKAVAAEPEQDYSSLNKGDLVALADSKGVDSSGTKADILGRLHG